ncbi:MAG: NAD(P)/FAD-dependent oxidoreductase [Flavobacterium sp.]|nr:NAD(P)/FAD-dependent oxidoreductase [Flavobacterium sp.]
MKSKSITIIGGGLAGLTAAIHLSKIGFLVNVIEKNNYPKHKVCGEYISNEVIPYLQSLGLDINELNPQNISKFEFSTTKGTSIKINLPLGGFGVSRFSLDEYLYKKAIENGCKVINEKVEKIIFENDTFTITTSENLILKSQILIGAFGKRSNIDYDLNRSFILEESPWLAVKAHYSGDFPNDYVGLYNFNGGYCGVSKIENNKINICYLADYKTFKKYKNIDEYQKAVLYQNPKLKRILQSVKLIYDKPLTISQISFEEKKVVENHILMIGDTAGLINPLCGNGMAMAIHSAKIVSELIEKFYNNEILSREELEKRFVKEWNFNFKDRLKTGRLLANLLQKPKLSEIFMQLLVTLPFLFSFIIKKTHGKPIII